MTRDKGTTTGWKDILEMELVNSEMEGLVGALREIQEYTKESGMDGFFNEK